MTQASKDNAVIFTGENEFRDVTIKGVDAQTIVKGEVLMYDVTDDTYITYSGATGKIPTCIYAGPDNTFATGALTITGAVCIKGDVDEDKITISSGDLIDDAPNSAAYSIREYLRQWGVRVYDYKELSS